MYCLWACGCVYVCFSSECECVLVVYEQVNKNSLSKFKMFSKFPNIFNITKKSIKRAYRMRT